MPTTVRHLNSAGGSAGVVVRVFAEDCFAGFDAVAQGQIPREGDDPEEKDDDEYDNGL
jgi:hypothetical protein